jgi:cytochrome c553
MRKRIVVAIFLISFVFAIASCSQYDKIQNNPEESMLDSDKSHNNGQNCMSCHNQNGNEAVREAGWWYIAGSIRDGNSGGYVELWTGPNATGNRIARLAIDKKGNFYTNKIINFGAGLYPVLKETDDKIKAHMSTNTKTGACNSCHGVSTSPLELD